MKKIENKIYYKLFIILFKTLLLESRFNCKNGTGSLKMTITLHNLK